MCVCACLRVHVYIIHRILTAITFLCVRLISGWWMPILNEIQYILYICIQ